MASAHVLHPLNLFMSIYEGSEYGGIIEMVYNDKRPSLVEQ